MRRWCGQVRRCLIGALLFAGLPCGFAAAQNNPPVTINVDAGSDRKPISPDIYGVAFGDAAALADLNVTINRSGGNHTSRYNWLLNADNRAFDWYFESLAYPSNVAGEVGDTFIAQSRAGGAEAMLTIPMIGWVATLGQGRSRLSSFSIAKYGAQADNDWQWFPDAGNGVRPNGQLVTGNDPHDANVPADSAFQLAWMQHLKTRWGGAAAGGLRYYLLDNEPSIWFSTHRDVYPTGPTMEQVRDSIVDYARRVKDNDPAALVVAPEEWGWDGYRWSGYDQQWGELHGWSNLPDRAAHGGWDYLPWLLDQLRLQSAADGRRLLDVFSVHYYPQGGEFSDVVTQSRQLLRNRSTRSLWDPNYVDQSWIADRVQLLPRIRGWVDTYYPGTKIALTEYNWGAEGHINGATAQADVLGILGREGVDLAARWTMPAAGTPTYRAIKMYRNYDGNRSTFGDTSVRATGPNPDTMATFAALRSADGVLTIMVVTKSLSGSTATTVNIANFSAGATAQAWQLTATNAITRLADLSVSGGALSVTLPPQSITLIVVAGGPRAPTATTTAADNVATTSATLNGTVNPNGSPTTAMMQWGTTTAYGSTTSEQSVGGGTTSAPVAASVAGLTPNTTYHYRVVATNGVGTTNGADRAFTTHQIPGGSVILTVAVLGAGVVTSGDGQINCPSACSATYVAGTPVTLTTVPGSGHSFGPWGGACGGSATTCALTLNSNQAVTATFSGVTFTDGSGPNSEIAGASVGGAGGTLIKAVHVIELRTAIDSVRASHGLGAFNWTDVTLTVRSTSVRRVHFLELRTALAAVCAVLPGKCAAYTDATLNSGQTIIKAVHLNELRANVRALE